MQARVALGKGQRRGVSRAAHEPLHFGISGGLFFRQSHHAAAGGFLVSAALLDGGNLRFERGVKSGLEAFLNGGAVGGVAQRAEQTARLTQKKRDGKVEVSL